MHIRYISLVVLCLFVCGSAVSQGVSDLQYHDASQLPLTGKINTTKEPFHRFDTSLYPLTPAIKNLLTHSAGLAVHFTSNTHRIGARWTVSGAKPGSNLTPIMQKGLDLYIKLNGKWQFAGVGRPNADSAVYTALIAEHMDGSEKEFLLYLPLYDGTRHLEIGVEQGASFKSLPEAFRKRVLIYGSSIVQGASASRSGMAYPAMLARTTGLNFLNLGLSGNAKMETAAADMVASIEADAYILDCMPNSSPEQVTERTEYLVKTIRTKHPRAPIFLMESILREHGYVDSVVANSVTRKNANFFTEFKKLRSSGIKDIYFIKATALLGNDHDGTTDGTHPNDLGFYRMMIGLKSEIMPLLKNYGIN